jgi:imidazolonepropionase-like amidohydrolase
VAPGFYADIIAAEGDPLADISVVSNRENIRWAMKSGRVVVDKTKGRSSWLRPSLFAAHRVA